MTMFIYGAIAIAFLILASKLFAKPRPYEHDEGISSPHRIPVPGTKHWLDLSERIFNPVDARWLKEELAFPKLAEALVLERKRLAIRWLEALQASFEEVVRTPVLTSDEVSDANSVGSWQMLWLTLRFKFLVSYALVVVKLFGPYHRLVPSFSWLPFSRGSEGRLRRPALANSRNSE